MDATELCPRLVRIVPTRLPWAGHIRRVATADRLVNRFWDYPRWLRQQTGDFDLFHIVDHSYAHLTAGCFPADNARNCLRIGISPFSSRSIATSIPSPSTW